MIVGIKPRPVKQWKQIASDIYSGGNSSASMIIQQDNIWTRYNIEWASMSTYQSCMQGEPPNAACITYGVGGLHYIILPENKRQVDIYRTLH